MSMLHVMYVENRGYFGIEDATPPIRLRFADMGEATDYAACHNVVLNRAGRVFWGAKMAELFRGYLMSELGLTDQNWPGWDRERDEAFQKYLDVHGGGDWEF